MAARWRMLSRAAAICEVERSRRAELGMAESGCRTVINCNRDAGQVVFHVPHALVGGPGTGLASRLILLLLRADGGQEAQMRAQQSL